MDDIDRAAEQEEMHLAAALSARNPVLHYNGHCYNCGETSAGIFCDADCRDDYQRYEAAKRRAGI